MDWTRHVRPIVNGQKTQMPQRAAQVVIKCEGNKTVVMKSLLAGDRVGKQKRCGFIGHRRKKRSESHSGAEQIEGGSVLPKLRLNPDPNTIPAVVPWGRHLWRGGSGSIDRLLWSLMPAISNPGNCHRITGPTCGSMRADGSPSSSSSPKIMAKPAESGQPPLTINWSGALPREWECRGRGCGACVNAVVATTQAVIQAECGVFAGIVIGAWRSRTPRRSTHRL